MQLRKLLQTGEDRAVSPVIGVILMVAITVILAAVIASFVLGLGDQQEVAPQATFDWEYDNSAGSESVTATHTNGDAIREDRLLVTGNSELDADGSGIDGGYWDGETSANLGGTSGIRTGDSATFDVTDDSNPDGYVVRLVWESSGGDQTSEISVDRGPDA